MRWVSYNDLNFERLACCWLIARFIDFKAQIALVGESELPSEERSSAMPFALGESAGFQSLIETFALRRNSALAELGEMIGRYRAAGPRLAALPDGLGLLLEGLGFVHGSPRRLLRRTFEVLDALYAATCERLGLGQSAVPPTRPHVEHRDRRPAERARLIPERAVVAVA